MRVARTHVTSVTWRSTAVGPVGHCKSLAIIPSDLETMGGF